MPRILVAAPASGSGKTLMTCALLRLLKRKGIRAAAFKCGPDYIDPMFHRRVLETPSRNLDLYLAGEEGILHSLSEGLREADAEIAVIEGVMGYLDGTGPDGLFASSFDLAVRTKTPVLLAVNARGMSRSVSAVVKGFAQYGEERQIRGILLNQVSERTREKLEKYIKDDAGLPVLAALPRDEEISFPGRILGLTEPDEIPDVQGKIDRAADLLEKNLDLPGLIAIARSAPDIKVPEDPDRSSGDWQFPVRIAAAMDQAFSFYYEDNLDLLKFFGAQIIPFSPIHDRELPASDGLLLGGGYPELWARELSDNISMRTSVRRSAESGMPILAECGGFQYLQQELETEDGNIYKMAGVLEGRSRMTGKLVRFGYAELCAREKSAFLDPGQRVRCHEFHYSDSTCCGDSCRAVRPGGGSFDCMTARGNILAGYPHLYYPSCPDLARRFVLSCRKYRQDRERQ